MSELKSPDHYIQLAKEGGIYMIPSEITELKIRVDFFNNVFKEIVNELQKPILYLNFIENDLFKVNKSRYYSIDESYIFGLNNELEIKFPALGKSNLNCLYIRKEVNSIEFEIHIGFKQKNITTYIAEDDFTNKCLNRAKIQENFRSLVSHYNNDVNSFIKSKLSHLFSNNFEYNVQAVNQYIIQNKLNKSKRNVNINTLAKNNEMFNLYQFNDHQDILKLTYDINCIEMPAKVKKLLINKNEL